MGSEGLPRPELRRLFSACDVNKSGLVEFEDFASLCRELSVRPTQVRLLFDKLDVDRDGIIDFQDFSARFEEVSEALDLAAFSPQPRTAAWDEFEERLGGEAQHLLRSREQLCEMYQQILAGSDFGLLQQYERLVVDMMQDFRAQRLNTEKLEHVLKRTEETASLQMAELEEDLQQHVAKMEHKIREEDQQKLEAAISEVQRRHEAEVLDLQALVDRLKKHQDERKLLESKGEGTKLKDQVFELSQENEHLRRNLLESETNVSLLQTKLDKLKNDMTDQEMQHEREKEVLTMMAEDNRGISSQIEILQAANKSLYDSNDSLRSALLSNAGSTRQRHSSPGRNSLPERASPNALPVITYSSYAAEEDSYRKFSDVAHWADKYLDSGVSLPHSLACSDEDNSPSDFGSERSESSEETLHRSYSYVPSDVEMSDIKTEVDGRVKGKRSSRSVSRSGSSASSRKRLPAFTPKKAGVMVEEESQGAGPLYRLVLAGDAGAGKSSFLLRLCLNEFRGEIPTTLGVDFQMKKLLVDGEHTTLQIWDTAGQERFRSIAKSYFRKAHGVLLMYDVTSESSFLNVRDWMEEIKNSAERSIPLMVIGNKIDRRAELTESDGVHTSHGEKLAMAYNSLFCETSAKDGTNVVEAVLHLAREVKKTVDLGEENSESVTKLSTPDKKDILANCCKT
ncbi:ras and EF-hand domain-containing protein-like [Rhinatrema bivittatum]|uniref:ras and EF-hand domain-containing protein-like n=1 Tax=Rhinatrema bivittatum TaxID=194408 RepID=UPI00112D8563|nr:ras and EF-hand domain-containing protein-like [Rhinatrema bivittatum]